MRPVLLAASLALCACQASVMMTPSPFTPPPPVENCLGKQLLEYFGKSRLMVGLATGSDSAATAAPYDVRYQYLTAGIADGSGPCSSCASGCTSGNTSCKGGGCGWWGCWQDDQEPPGAFARGFIADAKARNQIPMFTYYQQLYASGAFEGSAQIAKMNDASIMSRYFADFRFALRQVGDAKALIHLEPDTWAYGQQANADPSKTPVAVASANATDCTGMENTFAGFGRCMVAMVRKYAPNAKVGFHASAWATNISVGDNTDPSLDIAAEAKKTADFLKACGAQETDFVVVETSDRDAGFYAQNGDTSAFWDVTNKTLPNFHQAFAWATKIAEGVGRPLIWWQLPLGNSTTRYPDNRVDYFFQHSDEVAATHAVLMAFGAGKDDQTMPESDNGNLAARTKSYDAAGGQQLSCK